MAEGGLAVTYAPAGTAFKAEGSARVAGEQLTGWWSAEYQFDLTPKLAVRLATRRVFRQFSGDGWEAGFGYQHNLTPRHRPLYARAGLAYTRQTVARAAGDFANPIGGLRVSGTRLNADELSMAMQSSTDAVQPKLGLGLELSHKMELVAEVGYLLPMRTRTQLLLQEESGFFLARSSVAIALPSADVSLRVNDQPTTALPWRQQRWLLGVGLLYRLR
jgi:hypothetical protein